MTDTELNKMIINFAEEELPEVEEEVEVDVDDPAKVILYNDDWHTFEEVTGQLIKAINCDYEKAQKLTWEVHTNGKAAVYEGSMPECLQVSSILEEISLNTEIEY